MVEMNNGVEWLGVLISSFILMSFLCKGVITIRIINSIGCVVFIYCGLQSGAFSIWFFSVAILIINVVQINKEKKRIGELKKQIRELKKNENKLDKN